jgi:E3 ubiquitin-protein ligase RNF13
VTYLALGYLYFLVPVVLVVVVCMFLPFLFFSLVFYRRKMNQLPLNQKLIALLQRRVYSSDFELKDCPICLLEYVVNQSEVVVLPCNQNHHFHHKCIVSWLEINDSCPICRVKVTE